MNYPALDLFLTLAIHCRKSIVVCVAGEAPESLSHAQWSPDSAMGPSAGLVAEMALFQSLLSFFSVFWLVVMYGESSIAKTGLPLTGRGGMGNFRGALKKSL